MAARLQGQTHDQRGRRASGGGETVRAVVQAIRRARRRPPPPPRTPPERSSTGAGWVDPGMWARGGQEGPEGGEYPGIGSRGAGATGLRPAPGTCSSRFVLPSPHHMC